MAIIELLTYFYSYTWEFNVHSNAWLKFELGECAVICKKKLNYIIKKIVKKKINRILINQVSKTV